MKREGGKLTQTQYTPGIMPPPPPPPGAQEWSGSSSWYFTKDSAGLLPNCPLKAYNVHGYNGLFVTKVSLKSKLVV